MVPQRLQIHPEPHSARHDERPRKGPGRPVARAVLVCEHEPEHGDDAAWDGGDGANTRESDDEQREARDDDEKRPAVLGQIDAGHHHHEGEDADDHQHDAEREARTTAPLGRGVGDGVDVRGRGCGGRLLGYEGGRFRLRNQRRARLNRFRRGRVYISRLRRGGLGWGLSKDRFRGGLGRRWLLGRWFALLSGEDVRTSGQEVGRDVDHVVLDRRVVRRFVGGRLLPWGGGGLAGGGALSLAHGTKSLTASPVTHGGPENRVHRPVTVADLE